MKTKSPPDKIFASVGFAGIVLFFSIKVSDGFNWACFVSLCLSVSGSEQQIGSSGNSGWPLSDSGKNVQQLHRPSGKPGNHIYDRKTWLVLSQGTTY